MIRKAAVKILPVNSKYGVQSSSYKTVLSITSKFCKITFLLTPYLLLIYSRIFQYASSVEFEGRENRRGFEEE